MADAGKNKDKSAATTGGLMLRIVSPEKTLYEGSVESIIIKTPEGYEGFLKDRAPCCKLLADEGTVRLREAGGDFRTIKTKGGFAYMDKAMTVYADEAEWDEA